VPPPIVHAAWLLYSRLTLAGNAEPWPLPCRTGDGGDIL